MKVGRLNPIILILVFLVCSRTNASHTSDDDLFNVLFGTIPTQSPSVADTMPPTLTPSKSSTGAPTIGRSRLYGTESPSSVPTKDITTSYPTASPTSIVHKITESPSTHPTEVRSTPSPTHNVKKTTEAPTANNNISLSPTSSRNECNLSNGSFGIVTSEKRIVQYYYKVEYIPGANVAGILSDLERSISSIVLRETGIFPQCNSWTSIKGNTPQEQKIVGMSSAPADRVLSYCENACAIVEGRMTIYVSSSQSRRKLSVVDDGVNEILLTMKNSMLDGDLNSANSDILRVTYLESNDASIITDNPGFESEDSEKSDVPGQKNIPAYGYALLATSATLVVVVSAIAIRNRSQDNTDNDEESYDDEDPISLEDDGSTGCLDASAATSDRIFTIWKNMNR